MINLVYMITVLAVGLIGFLIFRRFHGLAFHYQEEKPVKGALGYAMSSAGVIIAIIAYAVYAVIVNVGLLG